MIPQLIARQHQVAQGRVTILRLCLDLVSDDEESCVRIVGLEDAENFFRVFGGCVVDCERYDFFRRAHMPGDIGPATLKVTDQEERGFVDDVKEKKDCWENKYEQSEEHVVVSGVLIQGRLTQSFEGTSER